jgi:two-component sensor histidine kinase
MFILVNAFLINRSVAGSVLFNTDSVTAMTDAGNYAGAVDYLLSVNDESANYSDSIRVEYFIELGENLAIVQKEGEGYNYLHQAMELALITKNKTLIDKSRIRLIEFYRKIRDYDRALDLIKTAESDLPIEARLLCSLYHRASAVYSEMYGAKNGTIPNYIDTALKYSYQSLAISRKNQFLSQKFIAYRELSSIYNATSKLHSKSKSELYMDSALMTVERSNKLTYYNLLKSKAHYFLNNNALDSSILYARKAIPFIDSLNNFQLQMELYWILSKSYFAKNDSLNGLIWMLKEAQADVKFRESYASSKLMELSTAYKVEEKDKLLAQKQQAFLKADQEKSFYFYLGAFLLVITLSIIFYSLKIKRKNKRLAELLVENEFLVGESNHRIKNNLQLIISLIGREVYKTNQQQSELIQISEKINAIAALHQQLYLTDKMDIISIKSYMDSIEQNLRSGLIQESVKLTMEIEDFEVPIDRAVYVGLLVTELIINSLKHAFEHTQLKSIKISAWKANEKSIHFNYQDNGKGIENNESPSLINLLLKQLKATITLDNAMGYNLNFKFKV